jgi:hypothetical protein
MKQIAFIFICLTTIVVNTKNAFSQIYTGNSNDSIVNCQSGEVTHGYLSNSITLQATAEIGAGLIRTSLSPNITYDLSISNYKGHQFGLSGSSYYFFQKNENDHFDISMNHFLGVSYIRLHEKKSNIGFSIRYLLNDSRNDFQGDAFMLSTNHSTNAWRISPALIFSNNLKTIFPSITITHVIF